MNLLSLLLVATASSVAYAAPPEFFIDIGACPFEGCQYGKWMARQDITLYAEKDPKSQVVARIKRGEKVIAVTGDVHTIPGKFKAFFEIGESPKIRIKANTVISVYTYCGEGYYKVWHRGKMVPIGLSEMPDFGKWIRQPKSIWWVKIKTNVGITGWTNTPEFDGRDSLA